MSFEEFGNGRSTLSFVLSVVMGVGVGCIVGHFCQNFINGFSIGAGLLGFVIPYAVHNQ